MAILSNKTKEECAKIANRFVEKGLFKEIVGATPHYQALPPYSALVSQLKTFHKYITDIKEKAPAQLNESFSELETHAEGVKQLKNYSDFILDLKDNTLSQLFDQKQDFDRVATTITQISKVSEVITDLEKNAKKIMDNQMGNITGQFKDISSRISDSMQHQIEDLTKQYEDISVEISNIIKSQVAKLAANLEAIKSKISRNLSKLRLGVLQQAVDQVIDMSFSDWINKITEDLTQQINTIEKVSKDGVVKTQIGLNRQIVQIQKLHDDGLGKTTEMFNTEFTSKLKDAIQTTVTSIDHVTSSTAKSGEDVKEIFVDISEKFGDAVSMAENKLRGVSKNVFNSFEKLKETFFEKIIQTLNDVLGDILNHLEISEKVTTEFWEKAKSGTSFTMKDIWFIRSIEGAKAHIDDEITKAKMRVLIVAPQITDINIDVINECPTHINIRIATYIDLNNPEHKAIKEEMDKVENLSYRNYTLQNLFGINRDYEDVILCVLSKTQIGEDLITEIAGIGSIIQEHIKIFVPILEDAWMSAHKELTVDLRTSIEKEEAQKPDVPTTSKEPVQKQELPQTPQETAPIISEPKKEPIQKQELPQTPQKTALITSEPKKEPVIKHEEIPAQIHPAPKPIIEAIKEPTTNKETSLEALFNKISNNLDTLKGKEISEILIDVRNEITENVGFSAILRPIGLTISSFKFKYNTLNDIELKDLKNKIELWRSKLNL